MRVSIPDRGLTVEFPDDMPHDEISKIIRRDIYGEAPEQTFDQPAYDRGAVRPNPASDRAVSQAALPGMMEQQEQLATDPDRIRPMNALVEGGKDVIKGSINFLRAANEAKARNVEKSGNKALADEIRRQGETDILYRQLNEKWLAPDGTFKRPEGFKGYVYDVVRMTPQVGAQIGVTLGGGPVAGGMFMGSQIAGQTVGDLEKQGVDPERAWKAALSNAMMQAPLEQIGIGKALKFWKPGKKAAQAIREMVETGGTEFLTEWAQKYPELAAKIWAQGRGKDANQMLDEFVEGFWEATKEGVYEGAVAAPLGIVASGAGVASQTESTTEKPIESPEITTPKPEVQTDNISNTIRENILNDLVNGKYTIEQAKRDLGKVPEQHRAAVEAGINDFESGRPNEPEISTTKELPQMMPQPKSAEESAQVFKEQRRPAEAAYETFEREGLLKTPQEKNQEIIDRTNIEAENEIDRNEFIRKQMRAEREVTTPESPPTRATEPAQEDSESVQAPPTKVWGGTLYRGTNTSGGRGASYAIDRSRAKAYGKNIVEAKLKNDANVLDLTMRDDELGWTTNYDGWAYKKYKKETVDPNHVSMGASWDLDFDRIKSDGYDAVVFEDEGATEVRILNKKAIQSLPSVDTQQRAAQTPPGESALSPPAATEQGAESAQPTAKGTPDGATKTARPVEQTPASIATKFNESTPGHNVKYDGEYDRTGINKPPLYQFTPQDGPAKGMTLAVDKPTVENIQAKIDEMVDRKTAFEAKHKDVNRLAKQAKSEQIPEAAIDQAMESGLRTGEAQGKAAEGVQAESEGSPAQKVAPGETAKVYRIPSGTRKNFLGVIDDAYKTAPRPTPIAKNIDVSGKPYTQNRKKIVDIKFEPIGDSFELKIEDGNLYRYDYKKGDKYGGKDSTGIAYNMTLPEARKAAESYLRGEFKQNGFVEFKSDTGAEYAIKNSVYHLSKFKDMVRKAKPAPSFEHTKSILKDQTGSSEMATDILNYAIELKNKGITSFGRFRRDMRQKFKDIWDKIRSVIKDLWGVVNNERGEIKVEMGKAESTSVFDQYFTTQEETIPKETASESTSGAASQFIDGFFMRAQFQLQDKFNYLNRAQSEAAKIRGEELPEHMDAYLAELRYHSMVGAEIDDLHRDHVEPLIDLMGKNKIGSKEAGEYLLARHAKEANAHLKRINLTKAEVEQKRSELKKHLESIKAERKQIRKEKPDKYPIDKRYKETDGAMMSIHAKLGRLDTYTPVDDNTALSGMTNERAEEVLSEISKSKKARIYEEIGRRVDAITKAERNLIRQSGLEKEETVDAWEEAYKHYVPTHREGKGDKLPSKGRGFDTRGGHKRRAGSTRAVDFARILPQVIGQYEATIVRAEKAKVGRAFLEFAKENEGPWKVDEVEYQPSFNSDGLVVYRPDPSFRLADNVVAVRVNGEEQHITFDKGDHAAMKIASALNNLDADANGFWVQALSKTTRYLAMINTGLNPEFIISNFARDLQTATYNMNDSEAHDIKMKSLKEVPKALRGIYQFRRSGKKDTEWAKWYNKFRKAGGQTGWVESYSDVNARRKKLERQIRRMKPDNLHTTLRGMRSIGEWVDDMNTIVENGVRLSVFKNLIEKGVSEAKAARVAKELTVNFNRKGNMGPAINAWKLFYNASIQGSVRILLAARNPRVRKLMYATTAFAMALDVINRTVGGDDEDGVPYYDKIPDWVKDRKLIVMLPKTLGGGEGEYLSVPLPWGYNVLHVIGQTFGEIATKKDKDPVKGGIRVMRAAIDAFNPVGGDVSLLQLLSPAALVPVVQVVENKDWTGKKIRPENDIYNPKPMSELYWSSVNEPSKEAAKFINQLTGGNEAKPGWLDISPEAIDHITEAVTGGMGKFFSRSVSAPMKIAKGEKVETYEIPFIRQVFGKPGRSSLTSEFYENIDTVRMAERQYKHYETDREMSQKIVKENRAELKLGELAREASKEISELRKERAELERRGETPKVSDKIRKIDNRIERIMRNFNGKFNARNN